MKATRTYESLLKPLWVKIEYKHPDKTVQSRLNRHVKWMHLVDFYDPTNIGYTKTHHIYCRVKPYESHLGYKEDEMQIGVIYTFDKLRMIVTYHKHRYGKLPRPVRIKPVEKK